MQVLLGCDVPKFDAHGWLNVLDGRVDIIVLGEAFVSYVVETPIIVAVTMRIKGDLLF
jgi:hypothetical protein